MIFLFLIYLCDRHKNDLFIYIMGVIKNSYIHFPNVFFHAVKALLNCFRGTNKIIFRSILYYSHIYGNLLHLVIYVYYFLVPRVRLLPSVILMLQIPYHVLNSPVISARVSEFVQKTGSNSNPRHNIHDSGHYSLLSRKLQGSRCFSSLFRKQIWIGLQCQ